jgi:ketosteroid isomerase-like protein
MHPVPRLYHERLREMSRENVNIVRAALNAWASDGREAFVEYLADDIDYRAIEGAPDDRGPMHGKDAFRAYVQDWLDTFDDVRTEVVDLSDAGEDNVIAVLRVSGRAKLSGVETDLTYAVVYTVQHGKIARGREHATRDEALENAGLSE